DERLVCRHLLYLACPDKIGTAVAHFGNEDMIVLYKSCRCCSRHALHMGVFTPLLPDNTVCLLYRGNESVIGADLSGETEERFLDYINGQLAGYLAAIRATNTVRDCKQDRVLAQRVVQEKGFLHALACCQVGCYIIVFIIRSHQTYICT